MTSFGSFNFSERLNTSTSSLALPCSLCFISKQVPGEQRTEEALCLSIVLSVSELMGAMRDVQHMPMSCKAVSSVCLQVLPCGWSHPSGAQKKVLGDPPGVPTLPGHSEESGEAEAGQKPILMLVLPPAK